MSDKQEHEWNPTRTSRGYWQCIRCLDVLRIKLGACLGEPAALRSRAIVRPREGDVLRRLYAPDGTRTALSMRDVADELGIAYHSVTLARRSARRRLMAFSGQVLGHRWYCERGLEPPDWHPETYCQRMHSSVSPANLELYHEFAAIITPDGPGSNAPGAGAADRAQE